MRSSVSIRFATFALMAPLALLLVAMPSVPATAVDAKGAAATCNANKATCVGSWNKDGSWSGQACDGPGTNANCNIVHCPNKGECVMDRRPGKKVLGTLKPPTTGMKLPGAGPAGPKGTRVPTAGAKFQTGSNRPPSFQPSGSAKRR